MAPVCVGVGVNGCVCVLVCGCVSVCECVLVCRFFGNNLKLANLILPLTQNGWQNRFDYIKITLQTICNKNYIMFCNNIHFIKSFILYIFLHHFLSVSECLLWVCLSG